ncbi:MAG: putative deoxyguanosinetriphosphate triphosphohydrolase [Candidatus Eremiobacteraeota bacterium]|nr:putative deoxyguanosinetriphosphate triphosphohydrolase [Candidatus Eremiobacteraeota bacterium]
MSPFDEYTSDDLAREYADDDRARNDERTPFERDRARIIHSAAFRRLGGKTQVYGLGASDYYRTRLTHSLEVAQIGKGLALRLNADTDLVEAICLAHDIGHPPFGHAGEAALHEEMSDVDGFNGNAQNIRILTNTESKSPRYPGLNLTRATLDGLIKYPQPIDPAGGITKGYYKSDEALVQGFCTEKERTFECQIMNWSDDVAYSAHDLEDALVIGTVTKEDLQSDTQRKSILSEAQRSYRKEHPQLHSERPLREQDVVELTEGVVRGCTSPGGDRIALIKSFVSQHISDCVTSTTSEPYSHRLRRYAYKLKPAPDMVRKVEIYKAITFACVILTGPVLTLQQAGQAVVRELYRAFADGGNSRLPYWYPIDWRGRVDAAITPAKLQNRADPLALKRLSRDYIATMTDRYAEEQWRRLTLPGQGGLFVARA